MTQQTLYRRLRDMRDRFIPPAGLNPPEISDGQLVMTLSPCPCRQLTATRVRDRLSLEWLRPGCSRSGR